MNTDIVKLESSESSEFRWSDASDSSSDVGSNAIVEYNGNNNEIEETSLTSHEGAINDPQLNGDGEYAQRRILPSSFRSFPSKVSSGPSKRFIGECALNEQWDPRQARPISVSENDQDNVHRSRSAFTHMTLPMVSRTGKYVQSPQVIGFNDSINRASLGEERLNECGERAIYQEALQNLDEPKLEDDLPKGLLSVTLLMHQRVALAWMVQKENSVHCAGGILADDQGLGKTVSMIALMLKQRFLQSKFICSNSQHSEPEALNLEDDDGVPELDKEKQLGKDDPKRKHVYRASSHTSGNWRPAAGTLVVCPATVVRQWAREIDEKVTRTAKLSLLIYHGGTRTRDPSDLAKYDVVITTYSIVTNEVPKQSIAASGDGEQRNLAECELSSEYSSKRRKQTSNAENKGKKKAKRLKNSHYDYDSGPLARVRWFRVVLDEAQTIKNHRTLVANACSGLRAKRRWCLSGTPVQNSIDDLYSYFRFLKYDPYAVYSSFYNSIKVPISKDASYGYKKLQAVLKTVLLRRTKSTLINGVPIVDLPPKTFFLEKVDFSPEERSFYSKLEADSRKQFKKFAAAGTVRKNYASILLMLLRLRQACNHPLLVKGCHSDTVGKDSLKMASQLPRDLLLNLLHQLEGSLAICRVCNDPPENAVVTMCGHVFCYQCVSERLNIGDNLCQASGCKETLGTEMLFSQATLQSCLSNQHVDSASTSGSAHNEEPSLLQSGYTSSKIKAALDILNSLCSQTYNLGSSYLSTTSGIPVKAIVFSQWNGMLNLVEDSLNRSLIQYRRLDGSMTLAARDNAVMEFNDDPEVTVMLMSLKAGNLGLNMVAACHVVLLDLWWNPATEDQAVDRAHRIGQIRPVTVSRLMIKDTVEDRILALQEEKRKIVSSAIGDDQPGGRARKLTMEDLKYLFMI